MNRRSFIKKTSKVSAGVLVAPLVISNIVPLAVQETVGPSLYDFLNEEKTYVWKNNVSLRDIEWELMKRIEAEWNNNGPLPNCFH